MNKICTSLEQSKKLIELGIDTNTADMCWQKIYDENHLLSDYRIELLPFRLYSGLGVPAWSLTALLSIIKPINDNSYTLIGTLDGGAIISFEEVTNVMFQEEEIIDAVFEMICWLKEINKL